MISFPFGFLFILVVVTVVISISTTIVVDAVAAATAEENLNGAVSDNNNNAIDSNTKTKISRYLRFPNKGASIIDSPNFNDNDDDEKRNDDSNRHHHQQQRQQRQTLDLADSNEHNLGLTKLNDNDDGDGDTTTCQSIIDTVCQMEDSKLFCDILMNNADLLPLSSDHTTDSKTTTVFVPTDQAFAFVDETLQLLTEQELTRIFHFHVYPGIYQTYETLQCGVTITNKKFGDSSRTRCNSARGNNNKDATTTDSHKYQKGNGNTKSGSLPQIIQQPTAIVACHGIIHQIDHLMFPVYLSQLENNSDNNDLLSDLSTTSGEPDPTSPPEPATEEEEPPSSRSSFVEECLITEEQPCDYDYLRQNLPTGKTQWFVVPDPDSAGTGCLDGSSYGFGVFLPPSVVSDTSSDEKTTTTTKLMIWFNGGGACYDYETCFGETATAQTAVKPETEGYFNYQLGDRNPLVQGNYAAVTVSYCSGDMHLGNAEVELSSSNNVRSKIAKFSGYNNTMSVLNWIEQQSELSLSSHGGTIAEIAASGCSAGSLGVQMWSNYLVNTLQVSKIQPDSYIGLLPPEANMVLNLWNTCAMAGLIGMSDDLVRQCECQDMAVEECLHTLPPVFVDFLIQHPTIPVAYTGSAHDVIQRGYYALLTTVKDNDSSRTAVDLNVNKTMKASFAYVTTQFPAYLLESLETFSDTGESVSSYIVDTIEHCFVNRDSTYVSTTTGGGGGGGNVGDRTVSKHANCLEQRSNNGKEECNTYQDLAHFVNAFLNDEVYDGTPSYPDPYPPSWHISCAENANYSQRIACDHHQCGATTTTNNPAHLRPFPTKDNHNHDDSEGENGVSLSSLSSESSLPFCFPLPGDGSGFPTKEQLAWLESEEARAWYTEYMTELNN